MKTVFAFDYLTRMYLGPRTLDASDESPMEPGVWLIPGDCLETSPLPIPAGKVAVEGHGAWEYHDAVEAVLSTPEKILGAAQASGLARIAEYSKSKRTQIAGTTDDGEMAGWTHKLKIAQAIGAGTATPPEIAAFQAEIDARGIDGETLAIFCAKVLGNAAFYAHAVGLIDGVKRRAQDAVRAATTPEQVEAALAAAKLQAEAAFAALMQGAEA